MTVVPHDCYIEEVGGRLVKITCLCPIGKDHTGMEMAEED